MTVTSQTYRTEHNGNGVTASFSTGFEFKQNKEVRIIHVAVAGAETIWTEGTQYTLTGADTGLAGSLTVRTSPTNFTPKLGEKLVVLRSVDLLQPMDGNSINSLSGADMEDAFDSVYHALQMIREMLDRAVIGPAGAGGVPTTFGTWSPIIGVVGDGERRVWRILDWFGGTGTKPATGFVGASGLVADVASAVDIRGSTGAATGLQAALNLADVADRSLAFLTLVTGTTAKLARSAPYLNVESVDGHGDSDFVIPATARTVVTNADFSGPRTWTLPAANTVNAGHRLLVIDLRGTVTAGNTLTVQRLGADTINNQPSIAMSVPYSALMFTSNGVNAWSASLVANSPSALIDALGTTRGAIPYRGLSGWAILVPGTAGTVLKSNGAGADPTWQADHFTEATEAQMEAAAVGGVGLTPANTKHHPGVAKCRAKYQVNVGLVDAVNIASVTDNGAGDWTFNFTTAFTDANFSANVTAEHTTTKCFAQVHSRTSSTLRVLVSDHAGAAVDPTYVDIQAWGAQ